MEFLCTTSLVIYYAVGIASLLFGAKLLQVIYQPDLMTPEQVGALRRRYLYLLITQWVLSICIAFLAQTTHRAVVFTFVFLLVPMFFSAWFNQLSRNQRTSYGLSILLVFLSLVSLFGSDIYSLYIVYH